jgi:hypothetical protein
MIRSCWSWWSQRPRRAAAKPSSPARRRPAVLRHRLCLEELESRRLLNAADPFGSAIPLTPNDGQPRAGLLGPAPAFYALTVMEAGRLTAAVAPTGGGHPPDAVVVGRPGPDAERRPVPQQPHRPHRRAPGRIARRDDLLPGSEGTGYQRGRLRPDDELHDHHRARAAFARGDCPLEHHGRGLHWRRQRRPRREQHLHGQGDRLPRRRRRHVRTRPGVHGRYRGHEHPRRRFHRRRQARSGHGQLHQPYHFDPGGQRGRHLPARPGVRHGRGLPVGAHRRGLQQGRQARPGRQRLRLRHGRGLPEQRGRHL